MHPELFRLPIVGLSVKSYGFCLMVGFLGAVWLAMRRAQRVKANPDVVLDMGFFLLVFGVLGARIFYVIHYWQTQFAYTSNKFLAVIDITQGGLEFLGGFIGGLLATVGYAWWKKVSLRLYLDILAPSLMWGLAFGRLGCYLNGCCFGGLCATVPSAEPATPWAVRFPYGSPAHVRQWENREVTVPGELVLSVPALLQPSLVPAATLDLPVDKRELPNRQYQDAQDAYEQAKAESPDSPRTAQLQQALKTAEIRKKKNDLKLVSLDWASRFPSRVAPERRTSVTELQDLASQFHSKPVHPAQLYAAVNALLLAGLLAAMFHRRKRHGMVMATLFVLYPITRIILELIRADNPHDVAGLTISQSVSLGMIIVGVASLLILYKRMPLRSPVLTGQ